MTAEITHRSAVFLSKLIARLRLKNGKIYDISGERLWEDDFKKAADNNLVTALNNSTFTLIEKIAFFKKKMVARTCCDYSSVCCGVDRSCNVDSAEIAGQ